MTDLNSSLTDFDKSLITEAPKPPELKPFSVWSEENKLAEADPQSYVQYSDYVREGYLDQGAYTPNVEEEISGSLNSKLADFGVVDDEGVQALTATKEPSFEEKFEYVRSSINSDEEDWKTLTDYKAGDEVVSAGGTVKPFQDKVAGLKERSEEIVNRRYNDVKRSLVESDQLPLAYVTNEEGQRELLVGDAAENMTVTQAIKASKIGGVSFKDGLVAQKLLSPIAGLDIKLYKFKKITEISEGIAELAQQDASVAEHVTGHTRQLARKDRSAFDSVGATITRGVSDLLTFAGVESEESNAEKQRIFLASHESFDNTVEYITEKLNASGANYNTKDVRDAYESHVINEGAKRGAFKLHQDPSEAGKNLYNTALGPVLNPAVFAREEDMINTLAAHPELTVQQKELFTKNRVDVLKQNFASYSKLLSESAVGDEWTKALVAGRQAGRDDLDVFDEFVAKDENFNEFTDSVKGIAYSVWDSVASLLYIAPAVMGADWAKDGLADASQRQSDRREVAQIFGEQYGLFQDVAESVAPLIVDVAATTALSSVTAGAGGAAYLAAKGGAQLTAKGLGKALTSNVLRATSKEGLEKVADNALAKGLIKKSLEKGHRDKTIEALELYNSEVAKKFGVTVGTFVPAATRSGAMSYGSLYNQLRKDPDLTEEEAHDRALGFALTSGAITGVITSSFSALGRGGVEDALLKGMTFRESKKLFQAMGNTTGIADETVAAAMKKVVGDSIKKYGATTLGKKVVKNAVDEGLEEGVDQLVNSFVEDVALNQDTPMLERMKQVWHAAQVGGILGGGVPAVQAAASRLGVTPMDQLEQRIRVQNEFVEQVSSELEGTGSPLAARQVREIMMSRVRDRRPSAPAPEVPDTVTITEQKVKSEQNAKRNQEIAQEISKLEDQSTLPKKAEEREAEVAQRAQRRVELEQEGVALSEEQQNLRALEEAPTTFGTPPVDQKVTPEVFIQSLNEASPLDVETAFENIRNQQNISFNNSEDTTVLKIEDTEAPPATETPFDYGVKTPRKIRTYSGRADIDFTKEQANAESAGVSLQGESRTNIGSHNSSSRGFDPSVSKRYSTRPSSDTLRFDDPPFSGANAEEKAIKLIDFAIANGFPVNIDPNVNYGLPLPSEASRQSVSEFVSSAVYTAYPKIAPPKNAKPYTSKQTAKTYFDPVSGKTVRQKVKGFVDDSGNGIFDNDPIVMIDMLKSGKLVKVPRSFGKANINPAIRIKDGVVVDVVGPTADGNLLESKVVDARHVSPIEPNNTRAAIIASIPFKKADLPAGVKDFDPLNGGPKSEDFADTTTIKRRIGVFSLELEKTGEEANRRVQSRLESNSGELSPEFRMAALESAKQEFLFNAQLISLREKLLANPATIINEVVAQTGSSNVNQAAQRLLPFIKVESNNNLTGSAILGLFVEQKLQNNPDFANNAPPTFDTLLAKAANRFKSQEETATSLRQQRAATTLPFDRTPSEFRNPKVSEWIANFGRNPEGDLASPEDISNAVSGAINTAIDAVNTDPDLRRAINKITLDHVLNDGTPEMADMVQTASARDIFGLFASWMSSGNGNTRESVTEFVEQLELGIYPSSAEFQNALLLVNLANRSDGASYENSDAVNAYRDLFNAGAKQEIDTDQARNTMIALTKAVRTHLSRSNISSAERSAITAQNESDIQRLKLESGNPESVIEALKDVSKNSDNPSHKVVADLLLLDTDFLKKVKFVLGSATADIAGKYVKGLDGSHTVFINKTSGNGRGLVNTLLEEYVHAFISDITSATDAQIEGMPRGTKTRLKALSTVLTNSRTAYAKQKKESGPVPALENALVDLNEFAAQFLLSEDVQKHVRSLVPPPNRSSFFSRFLTNIVMLFPKAGAKDVKEAVKALEDVLDVGSNTRKTAPTDPKVLGGSLAGKALFSSPVTRSKEELLDLQREAENARLEANSREVEALAEEFLASVPEADRPKMGNLLNYVRGLLPLGMDMKITTESDGSSAFVTSDSSTVFVNPIAMLKQAGDISDAASRAIIGTIINEELTHTASFNALSMEEVQAYIDSLSESDFVDIAKEYHGDNDAGLKTTLAQLNSEDPSVVADARYRMAEEKLRMHLQKVTRGFTTEDDIQFWKSKPSLLGMLGRYFRGIINRWVAKREQIGPAADVALNKLIIEMRAIEVGFVRQPTKMPFDPETPMNVFRMFGTVNQNFVALASAPTTAAPSGQPTGTGIDFSAVVDLLEAPVYEIETEQPKNFIMKFLTEMFAGQLPEAFRRLVQNRDAYKRLTESNVIAYKTEMDKLIKATYGSYDNAPMEMIARAQGYYSGNVVTEEVLNRIEEAYDKAHAAAEVDRKAGNITKGEADTLKSIADKIRTNDTNKAYDAAVKVREADRDAALRDLAKESPKLAAHIIDIREKLIIPLQKKLVKSGLDSKIGVKISKTGGIYVTRSYQMFTDSSYLEKVKTDPNYQKVRDAAMKFFADEFVKKTTKDLVNSGMDPSLAKIEAGEILERENQSSPHNSYGQEALNAFLMQYEKGGRDSTTLGPKDYKMIENNLKRRRDLPEEIRDLLGELGPKSGIDLILRTYSTVATLTSQQAFLNQLKDFGVKSGVMVTTENKFATKENRDKYSNFVPARSGVPSKSDPLSGMHVSPEFKEALDVTLKDSYMMDYADTAEKAVKGIFGLASNLSGKAMAAKTLGSIGFYGRNAVGNLLFGTSQGFFRYDKMIAAMTKSSIDAFTGASGKIDPVVSELIGLNVMGDELRAGVMRDLLNGKVTPEGIRKQIAELGEKTKLNKLTKGLAFVEKKAQDLSAALDAAYKVAYYNHELNILKEARAADTGKGTVDLAAMEDTEIKRLAARKVVMTSQAYSQAPPAVAAFTKSGLGLVFAPFIRFKMEVPRIVINTFKLAKEEIDSKNPVLVRRGMLRMGSMIGTLGVLSSAVPMIMAALSGIGDEEDEAMRASIPDYLRGHTFFYFGEGKNLKSIDLTYVNPYSLIVDPFLRSYENIRRGEFTEAGAALAIGFVRDQYLDDQILAGAVRDATRNVNPSTGKPIWNNGADGPVEAGSKILSYIAKEAYAPRLGKDFVNGWSTGSLSGMVGEIADGAMPARIHDVDLQKQYSRYLLDLNKRFNNVKSGLNAVKRNAPMSDGEVGDIIDDNIEDRRLLNYELMRVNKGFSSLGLTDTDLLKGMKEMKLGRDRVALLSRGYMDRPSPKYIIESLLDPRTDEYGAGRAQQILNHYRNINRYIPIRPITESE